MQKTSLLLIVVLVFVVGLAIGNSPVQGISPFSSIGNLEMEVLDAINDIITALNVEASKINSLNSTQISEQVEQDEVQIDISNLQVDLTITQDHIADHHTERLVADAQISGLDARLFSLENQKEEFNIELRPFGSTDGAIRLISRAGMLLYSDELCKIDSGTAGGSHVYIQFGNTTTVIHETDCEPGPSGQLITLASGTDEIFNKGDVLMLRSDFTNGFTWVEIYQDKS